MAKFVKYFLLTAKVANGNAWKINPETAEHNMKYFVNRPLICTDRSWFPNSAYDSYDHAYLPSNDLYAVLRHQEPYRVGTIREIQKTGDNYYAIAEILPKFASKSFPVFCSPAIFQVNPMEDEGHINQWIPLHLAILDTSPAYGPSIALLKGTCSGTPEACSIQLKTAKLLMAATGIELKDCENCGGVGRVNVGRGTKDEGKLGSRTCLDCFGSGSISHPNIPPFITSVCL